MSEAKPQSRGAVLFGSFFLGVKKKGLAGEGETLSIGMKEQNMDLPEGIPCGKGQKNAVN
ncbi:hypothetical protein [Kangiella sp. M94]